MEQQRYGENSMTHKECREMKWLKDGKLGYLCPDCGCRCNAITMKAGVEVCSKCMTVALIPDKKDEWAQYLPMKADYEVNDDGTKKLLGWHPESQPEDCALIKSKDSDK